MTTHPHVLVLGLGITGSSIAATLASQGVRVTAFEQFAALHDRGSSHGDSRIFRRVPHEGPAYVEMANASWDGWRAWSKMAGEKLLVDCGGIDAGPDGSAMVDESENLCRTYGHAYEILTGAAFNQRHPHFNLPSGWKVAYQPRSGFVRPDATRAFLHKMAITAGAVLHHDTRVLDIDPGPGCVKIHTDRGAVTGDFLIVAAGGWLPKVLPELSLPLSIERRVLAWFQARGNEPLSDGRLPIFCLDSDGGWYGMPTPDGTIKIGHDKHLSQRIDPDQQTIEPDDTDVMRLMPCIDRYFNGFECTPSAMKSCIYTLTPTHHFIMDRHPRQENILVFSCCSGHGFKYAPAYGKIALDMIGGKAFSYTGAFSISLSGQGTTRFSE